MNSFLLGIDVGGTNIRIASFDASVNRISDIKKFVLKRTGDPVTEINDNLCKPIIQAIEEKQREGKELKGIGLSVASLFERESGKITIWPNNRVWDGFPLKEYLTLKFNVPVVMEDDANSAALGEHLMGAGRGYRNFAYITIGTGVGCGLILNDSLYIGSNGWAGEIGHIRITEKGPECVCGMKGCLQSLISGPALLKKFNEVKCPQNFKTGKPFSLEEIVGMAERGDSDAKGLFSQAGVHIGNVITGLVMLLDISTIILGGGVANSGDLLLKPASNTVNTCLKKFNRDINIKKAQLGEKSGAIGALGLIYENINGGKTINASMR